MRLKGGLDITKGLLVLGNAISTLEDPKKKGRVFVPYGDSKLTKFLKGSLSGNNRKFLNDCLCKSFIIDSAKNIQSNVVVNIDAGS
jgi:hypothetical protein